MIDKVEIHKIVDFDAEAVAIIDKNHLECCTRGEKTYWQSTAWGNFDGLFLKLEPGGHLQIKCSLHKIWRKVMEDGKLDNSRMFCLTHAIESIDVLAEMVGTRLDDAEVTYFEIGLNLRMTDEAARWIAEVDGVDCQKGAKEMYIDANYEANRQKTSLKTKDMRKVLKMYDKTFEAADRGRDDVEANVLRIETMYKRQRVAMAEFRTRQWLDKYVHRFLMDWSAVRFKRYMAFAKGMKQSQVDKAREIMRVGLDEYLKVSRLDYIERRTTKKQWETIRTFARSWPDIAECFWWEQSRYEKEYREQLKSQFEIAYL